MPLENFLITFHTGVSAENIRRLAAFVVSSGGNVVLVSGHNQALIVAATQPLADRLRRLPFVRHVGGVRIGQRKIVRRQVRQD